MLEVSNHSTVAAGFIHRMYIEVQLMSIRRMTDSTKPTHSLRRLLGQLAEHSCAITRTSFVARITNGSDDWVEVSDANKRFDDYSTPDAPDVLSRAYVFRDIDELRSTTDELKTYVDEHLAHADAQLSPESATTRHLNDGLDLLVHAFLRYSPIVAGVVESDIPPMMALDWREPFRNALF